MKDPPNPKRGMAVAATVSTVSLLLGSLSQPIASRLWPIEQFEIYAMGYRFLAMILPLCVFGMTVSIPQLLPSRAGLQRRSLLVAAALVAFASWIVLAGSILVIWPGQIARLLGTDVSGPTLSTSVAILLAGATVTALAAAVMRATFHAPTGSALQFLYIGAAPLLAVVTVTTASSAFVVIGTAASVAAFAVLLITFRRSASDWVLPHRSTVHADLARLTAYGARRLPGELVLFGLFAVPPLLLSFTGNRTRAVAVSVSISLIVAGGGVFAAVSDVLVPYFARSGSHSPATLGRCIFGLGVTATAGLLAIVLGPAIIELYVGERYGTQRRSIQIVLCGGGFYVLYCTSRSWVDAISRRPVSMYVAGFAGVFAIVIGTVAASFRYAYEVELGFFSGLTLLGLGTLAVASLINPVARK